MEIFMIDDRMFIDRIARSMYVMKLGLTDDAWDKLNDEAKRFWRSEVEQFIAATNHANIALYDSMDVR
jgi:hypothetical protein